MKKGPFSYQNGIIHFSLLIAFTNFSKESMILSGPLRFLNISPKNFAFYAIIIIYTAVAVYTKLAIPRNEITICVLKLGSAVKEKFIQQRAESRDEHSESREFKKSIFLSKK